METAIINRAIFDKQENKVLKGFQNTSKHLSSPGITVGRDGASYDILHFDLIDYIRQFGNDYANDESRALIAIAAKSLSKNSRYIGNTNGTMSVAQHSYIMAQSALLLGDPVLAMQCLIHDIGEIFIPDISTPLKKILKNADIGGITLGEIEECIDRQIAEFFGMPFPYDPMVKILDTNCAQREMTTMISEDTFTDYWNSEKAETMFMEMYKEILLFTRYQNK